MQYYHNSTTIYFLDLVSAVSAVLNDKQRNILERMVSTVDTIVEIETNKDMSKVKVGSRKSESVNTRIYNRIMEDLCYRYYFSVVVEFAKAMKVNLPDEMVAKANTTQGAKLCLMTIATAIVDTLNFPTHAK